MADDWLDRLRKHEEGPEWRERLRNYTTAGIPLIPQLEGELIAELGFTGDAARRLLDDKAVLFALAMAYTAGTKAGRVELGAEAQEQGIYLPADLVTPPPELE